MANTKEQEIKTPPQERLAAFYDWCKSHEFTLKDLEAVLCGIIIQTQIKGYQDELTLAGRTFEIVVKEKQPEEQKETKKESKDNA